ncbi:bifunctional 2-polyprenyl-6-hydroxyphenol methylase/3-demethylubiquinol 3-O-methyltransferase UbiG [Zhongshania sp.]|uniref:class I SAM-dependent methyltransferase n=1 Tax=Zhongshania sp. TaxID=1971902 RepID=UPI00262A5C0A|nr:class I SAM-dependent methyltransferase [Zhongshania sp.]
MNSHQPSLSSRAKWNQRHQQRELPVAACRVLQNHRDLLPCTGLALDVACGLGGNAVLLAQAGLECEAVDISDVAVTRLNDYARSQNLSLTARQADIETNGLGLVSNLVAKQYDVITVSYFLYRPLFPALIAALKPGGLLFYQTFVSTAAGEMRGPKNSNFYLHKKELLSHFKGLEIRYYCEGPHDRNDNAAAEAELIARKPSSWNSSDGSLCSDTRSSN